MKKFATEAESSVLREVLRLKIVSENVHGIRLT